jgi:hypothetical protein
MRYVRQALAPGRFASLSGGLRTALIDASQSLPTLRALPFAIIREAPDVQFAALRHALSAHFVALNGARPDRGRSPVEAKALDRFETEFGGLAIGSPATFRARLAALNQEATEGAATWRSGPIRLGRDRAGNEVIFPPVAAVPGQLERIRQFLVGGERPVFTAAVAYALMLNCHPFTDGNGRTARLVFNLLLRRGGMPRDVYIPLHEIARRSMGGYEITLRIAEMRGDWAPFLRFVLSAIACHQRIAVAAQIPPPRRLAGRHG